MLRPRGGAHTSVGGGSGESANSTNGVSGSGGGGGVAQSSGSGSGSRKVEEHAHGSDTEDVGSQFECHICLETAAEPTITQCGHLFCWACLYRWMETGHDECPVCKAGVAKENVIPLYGRGRKQKDPRDTIPPRPAGHRPERPQRQRGFGGAPAQGQFGGVAFTAGVGFFPSLFGLQFQAFPSPTTDANATPEEVHQAFLSKILIFVAVLVLFILLFF